MTPPTPDPKLPADVQFQSLPYKPCEITHRYGDKVHILGDPLSLAMLARLFRHGEITHHGVTAQLANDPRVIATYLGGQT